MNSKLLVLLALAAPLAAQDRGKRPAVEPAEAPAHATTQPAAPTKAAARKTLEKVGFETPESVLHDEVDDVYLVSNIHGAPTAADDNGFISRLKPDGTIENLKWIEAGKNGVKLDAPKGMAIVKDTLWVADITNVRKFDRKTGKPLGSIAVPGATFLNDVAANAAGVVFVTDTGLKPDFSDSATDALVKITTDDKVEVTKLPGKKPNGVCVLAGGVLCQVSWTTGEVTLDAGKGATVLTKLPKAQLDGVVALAGDTLLVSSWEGKCVYKVARVPGKDGVSVQELATGLEAPADLGYDAKRQRLLIPLFTENKVVIWPLGGS